jgi:transaldolase
MGKGYFHRVNELSPTRFWINNPTPEEARRAILHGAISSTTNPTYSMKQINAASEQAFALGIVDEAIRKTEDDGQAADLVQQKLVKRVLDIFFPVYTKSPREKGFVSIQGDPFKDDDPAHIVNEALRYKNLAENFIAKVPATKAGLKAIETLIPEDIPIIATEVMAIPQAVYTCELYERVSKQSGTHPPFFLTHITGIFEEHLKNVVERENVKIPPDILWQAGCIVARKQYRMFKERGYPGVMLGGGARGLHHFTELVGSEMHITINWKGTADRLIESDPPVVHRIDTPAPRYVVDWLMEIPDFRHAYLEDGLTVDEFKDFGPVVLFRNSFLKGWRFLLDKIRERRELA